MATLGRTLARYWRDPLADQPWGGIAVGKSNSKSNRNRNSSSNYSNNEVTNIVIATITVAVILK